MRCKFWRPWNSVLPHPPATCVSETGYRELWSLRVVCCVSVCVSAETYSREYFAFYNYRTTCFVRFCTFRHTSHPRGSTSSSRRLARGRRKIERIDLKVCLTVCGNRAWRCRNVTRKEGRVRTIINQQCCKECYPSISHGQMPTAHGGPSSHVATPQATTYAHTSL